MSTTVEMLAKLREMTVAFLVTAVFIVCWMLLEAWLNHARDRELDRRAELIDAWSRRDGDG